MLESVSIESEWRSSLIQIRFVGDGKEESEKILACPTTGFIQLLPPFAVTLFMANRQGMAAYPGGFADGPGPRGAAGTDPARRAGVSRPTGFPYCRSRPRGQPVSRNPGGKTNGRFADGRQEPA